MDNTIAPHKSAQASRLRKNLEQEIANLKLAHEKTLAHLEIKLESYKLQESLEIEGYDTLLTSALPFIQVSPQSLNLKSIFRFAKMCKPYMAKFASLALNSSLSDNQSLRTHNLEIQDNAYGGNLTMYLNLVQKNFATRYHPNLFSFSVVNAITDEQLVAVGRHFEKLSKLSVEIHEGVDTCIIRFPVEFEPLLKQSFMLVKLEAEGTVELIDDCYVATFDRALIRN